MSTPLERLPQSTPADDLTSISLLRRVASPDDTTSWQQFSQLYVPLLRRWISRYGIQAADANDLVQEVLSTVHREIPNFQHNKRPGAFRNWLRTTLEYRIRNYWRSRKYRPLTGGTSIDNKLDDLRDGTSNLSQAWNREHDQHVMQSLLRRVQLQFSDQTWQTFHRYVIQNESAATVAESSKISIASVYMAKSRVLAALRRESEGLIDEI